VRLSIGFPLDLNHPAGRRGDVDTTYSQNVETKQPDAFSQDKMKVALNKRTSETPLHLPFLHQELGLGLEFQPNCAVSCSPLRAKC
jgi:hypothetical protein